MGLQEDLTLLHASKPIPASHGSCCTVYSSNPNDCSACEQTKIPHLTRHWSMQQGPHVDCWAETPIAPVQQSQSLL